MRLVALGILALISNSAFASSQAGCALSTAPTGATHSDQVKTTVVIDQSQPRQSLGVFGPTQFTFVYKSGGAAGPVDTVAIEWSDDSGTYQTMQFYSGTEPVRLMAFGKTPAGTFYVLCGSCDDTQGIYKCAH